MAKDTHNNLGVVLKGQGKLEEAAACYKRAFQIRPDLVEAHYNLGGVCLMQQKLDEAVACYQRALQINPNHAEAHYSLGLAFSEQIKLDEATASYERSLQIESSNCVRFALATLLPVIYQSTDEVEFYRNRLVDRLTRLRQEGVQIDLDNEGIPTTFYLTYQGHNDRTILETVAQLCAGSSRDYTRGKSAQSHLNGKIRIGFISAHFREHTVAEVWQGVIAKLSRDKFSVTILYIADQDDPVTQSIRVTGDRFIQLPQNPRTARQIIAEQELDILFYTDIGMHASTYALASSRLAPVPTWGHPVTSGLSTLDYFISSELLEPDNAGEHYTEKLVRLKSLGIYYYRPRLPAPSKERADFGLPEDKHLYACLQTLFKFHPSVVSEK